MFPRYFENNLIYGKLLTNHLHSKIGHFIKVPSLIPKSNSSIMTKIKTYKIKHTSMVSANNAANATIYSNRAQVDTKKYLLCNVAQLTHKDARKVGI